MASANICKGYSGDMVLEIWNGERKVTVYVDKRNIITTCLIVDENGTVDEAGLFAALRFLHEAQERKES